MPQCRFTRDTDTAASVHNNIVKVNHLELNTNYHVFKKGIRPEWEDAANANGGKFSIQFPRNRTGEAINDYWLNLVMLDGGRRGGMISLTLRRRFSPCWESNSSTRTKFAVLLYLCAKYFIELLFGSRVLKETKESKLSGKVYVMLTTTGTHVLTPTFIAVN